MDGEADDGDVTTAGVCFALCVEIAGDDSLGLLDVKVVDDVDLVGVGDTAFEGTFAVGFNKDDDVADDVVVVLLIEDVPCAVVVDDDDAVEEEEEAREDDARDDAVGLWREDDLAVVVGDEAPDDADDAGDDVLVLESEEDGVVDLRLVDPKRWLDDVADDEAAAVERWLDEAVGA